MSGPSTRFLLDANVLIALVGEQHVHHHTAHRWFEAISSWATTPLTETAFVRLVSNPAVVGGDVSPADAIALLRRLRALAGHAFIEDSRSLTLPLIDLTAMVGHRQVTDFHLVNLAAGSGAVLATFDARLAAALAPADRAHVEVIAV